MGYNDQFYILHFTILLVKLRKTIQAIILIHFLNPLSDGY